MKTQENPVLTCGTTYTLLAKVQRVEDTPQPSLLNC